MIFGKETPTGRALNLNLFNTKNGTDDIISLFSEEDYEQVCKIFEQNLVVKLKMLQDDKKKGEQYQENVSELKNKILEKERLSDALKLVVASSDKSIVKVLKDQISNTGRDISKLKDELIALDGEAPNRSIEANDRNIECLQELYGVHKKFTEDPDHRDEMDSMLPLTYAILALLNELDGMCIVGGLGVHQFLKEKGKTNMYRDEVHNMLGLVLTNSDYASKCYPYKNSPQKSIHFNMQLIVGFSYNSHAIGLSVYSKALGEMYSFSSSYYGKTIQSKMITFIEDKMESRNSIKKSKREWAEEEDAHRADGEKQILSEFIDGWEKFFPYGEVREFSNPVSILYVINSLQEELNKIREDKRVEDIAKATLRQKEFIAEAKAKKMLSRKK